MTVDGFATQQEDAKWQSLRKQGAACAQRGELGKARDLIAEALDLYRSKTTRRSSPLSTPNWATYTSSSGIWMTQSSASGRR